MVNREEFIKKLERIMEFYGLSATAFAEELEFNRSTISHLLSGRNKPSLDFVVKILQKFPEVTMSWLIFGKGDFPFSSENIDKISNSESSSKTVEPGKANSLVKEIMMENDSSTDKSSSPKTVEKIIILYSDGSFNIYEN